MKLVNAKLKPLSQQPPGIVCCLRMKEHLIAHAEEVVQVDVHRTFKTIPNKTFSKCVFCAHEIEDSGTLVYDMTSNDGTYLLLNMIDLEE